MNEVVLSITVEGEPVPKGRPRLGAWGRIYTPPETKKAEADIGWQLKGALRDTPPDALGLFAVVLTFHCQSARSDLDNLAKLVLDAANKLVWRDDRQVVQLNVNLYRDAAKPFTSIVIVKTGEKVEVKKRRKAKA